MPTIHFLNVKDGDCSIIEHYSGHKTVIDVCNAKPVDPRREALMATEAKAERGISGNFQQKKYPVNPISYMRDHGINDIFRYVQTHPDMDHMDGIEALFDEFSPANFHDTANPNFRGAIYGFPRVLQGHTEAVSPLGRVTWITAADIFPMRSDHDFAHEKHASGD